MNEAPIEKQAKQALSALDFPKFFALLEKVSEFEKQQLALEAVNVAELHRNGEALRQLANLPLSKYDAERLFENALQSLIKLKAIDIAISLAVLGNKQLATDVRWYLLAQALLTGDYFAQLKDTIAYVHESYRRSDIAKKCLEKIKPEQSLLEWLHWYDLYLQADNYATSQLTSTVISALMQYADFPVVCQRLKAMKENRGKQSLLQKVYIKLIVSKEGVKLQHLESVLSDDTRWLVQVRELLDDEKHFPVLAKLDYAEAEIMLPVAINNLIQRQSHSDDENLAKLIIVAAEAAQSAKASVIEMGCNLCLQQSRLNAVINLLAHLDQYSLRKQLLLLTQHNLRAPQVQAILAYLPKLLIPAECYESDEIKILKRLPAEALSQEHQRRIQAVLKQAETAFAGLDKISRKHPQFDAIHQMIDKLFEYEELTAVLTLCKKIVASKHRDSLVRRLFHAALTKDNFMLAQESCALLLDKEEKSECRNYTKHYQKQNYRQALRALVKSEQAAEQKKKITYRSEHVQLIYDCIEKILAKEDETNALQFLEAAGVFCLGSDYFEDTEAGELKEKIVDAMAARCRDHQARKRLINRLKIHDRTTIMVYALRAFLKRSQLTAVVEVLNTVTEESYGRASLPEKIEKVMNKYFDSQTATVEQLMCLSAVTAADVRQSLIRRCLHNFSLDLAKVLLPSIARFVDAELKRRYLLETIVLSITQSDCVLAQQAVKHLESEEGRLWEEVIKHAKENQIVALLNLIIRETLADDVLLNWVINKWLATEPSISYLLKHCKLFLQELAAHRDAKSKVDQSDQWRHYYDKLGLYEKLIRETFRKLVQLLKQRTADNELVECCAELLPLAVKAELAGEFLKPLYEIATSLIERSFVLALQTVQLILLYEKNFPDYFLSELLEKLLKAKALDAACQLMQRVDAKNNYWLERAALKVASGYFQQGNYQKMIELLSPLVSSYTVCTTVVDWVLQIINNGKLDDAKLLIQSLLPKTSDEQMASIIDALLNKQYVVTAMHYLSNIQTPATRVRLQQAIQAAYLKRLGVWIEETNANKLFHLQQQIAEYMHLIKIPTEKEKANHVKNEVIVEMRNILDRAFIAFYRKSYGDPPPRVNAYFPVVPKRQKPTVREDLQFYFSTLLKTPSFSADFPDLFNYLLQIQPLDNAAYSWLDQLYRLANTHKHDTELPFQPMVEAVEINMVAYLPKILNGVTELLFKLYNHKWDINTINGLSFTTYVPLQPLVSNNYSPALFRPASPPRAVLERVAEGVQLAANGNGLHH